MVIAGSHSKSQVTSKTASPKINDTQQQSTHKRNNSYRDSFMKQSPDGSSIKDGAVEFDIYASEDNLSVDSGKIEGNSSERSPVDAGTSGRLGGENGFHMIETSSTG